MALIVWHTGTYSTLPLPAAKANIVVLVCILAFVGYFYICALCLDFRRVALIQILVQNLAYLRTDLFFLTYIPKFFAPSS